MKRTRRGKTRGRGTRGSQIGSSQSIGGCMPVEDMLHADARKFPDDELVKVTLLISRRHRDHLERLVPNPFRSMSDAVRCALDCFMQSARPLFEERDDPQSLWHANRSLEYANNLLRAAMVDGFGVTLNFAENSRRIIALAGLREVRMAYDQAAAAFMALRERRDSGENAKRDDVA